MGARCAAWTAIGLGTLSMALCIIFVPILWSKVSGIQNRMRMDLDEFKMMEEDIWTEVMDIRKNVPRPRLARQAAACGKFSILNTILSKISV